MLRSVIGYPDDGICIGQFIRLVMRIWQGDEPRSD